MDKELRSKNYGEQKTENPLRVIHHSSFIIRVRGFSLIEATIVMILMAVAASLFSFSSFNSANTRFYGARETLKTDLRKAKNMALHPTDTAAGYCAAGVLLEVSQYTLFYNQACDGAIASPDFVVDRVSLPTGIRIGSPGILNFKIPYGEAADAAGVMLVSELPLTVKTADNRQQSIVRVTPLGQVY